MAFAWVSLGVLGLWVHLGVLGYRAYLVSLGPLESIRLPLWQTRYLIRVFRVSFGVLVVAIAYSVTNDDAHYCNSDSYAYNGRAVSDPPVSVRGYLLPPLPPGGLLPRPPPLGLPVVAGALGGLDEPLAIGLLLAML